MGVGLRLKTILRERKMTIKQLAEETGIPLNTLYSITKRDSERVDPVIIQKIAETLIVSPAFLIGVTREDQDGNEIIDIGLAAIIIGEILGVDKSVVYDVMKRLEISPSTIDGFNRIVDVAPFWDAIEDTTHEIYLNAIKRELQKLNLDGQQRVTDYAVHLARDLAKIPEYQRENLDKTKPQAEAQDGESVSESDTE